MSKLGYFTFRVYLKFQNVSEEDVESMIGFLKEEENIWTIAKLLGKWDYAFFVGVKRIEDFHRTWNAFLLRFKKHISRNSISLYSPIHNFNKRFFMPDGKDVIERVIGIGEEEKVDDTDLRIIKEWGKDVRQPSTDIARKLRTSPKTIINRIKALKRKNIIVGCKVDIDQGKLGYQGYRADLSLNSTERKHELHSYCKNHPNIYQINDSIGGADFEFEIIVKDIEELLRIINDMAKTFEGMIRDFEYFSFLIFPKLTIVPD
jgi:DNA-binding Lrp family transcriptional regulator